MWRIFFKILKCDESKYELCRRVLLSLDPLLGHNKPSSSHALSPRLRVRPSRAGAVLACTPHVHAASLDRRHVRLHRRLPAGALAAAGVSSATVATMTVAPTGWARLRFGPSGSVLPRRMPPAFVFERACSEG